MKTLTEFAAISLKNAAKTKQELTTAGKTAEELPAAMGEALKLEGDKLAFIMNALEIVEAKGGDLKRVVVFSLAEGEKAPQGSVQKGEQYYSAEYYPPLNPPKGRGPGPGDDKGRGGRGDKKGKRGGRGGRGGGRGGERQGAGRGEGGGGGKPGEGRSQRPPRGPRPERSAQAPRGPVSLPKPLQKPIEKADAATRVETPTPDQDKS